MLVNTMMVVLFQVRASRGTEDLTGAARASRRAGVGDRGRLRALRRQRRRVHAASRSALLLAGAFVHVIGELWHAAAGWGISFGLAPAHAQGQYQGAYGMGMQLGGMVAPVVVTTLAVGWGVPGWLRARACCSCCSGCWCRRWCAGRRGPVRPSRRRASRSPVG